VNNMQLKEATQILENNGYRIELIRREFINFDDYAEQKLKEMENEPTRNRKADKYWKKEKTGK